MAYSGIPRFKVILTGEYGVGKTSIFHRFVSNSLDVDGVTSLTKSRPHQAGEIKLVNNCASKNGYHNNRLISMETKWTGLDNFTRQFKPSSGCTVELELWDTSGLERFGSLSANYYSGASAVIVCFSVIDPLSLSFATQCILEAIEHAGRSNSSTGTCPLLFLCGTKSDGQSRTVGIPPTAAASAPPDDDFSGARRLLMEYESIINRLYIVSSQNSCDIEEMFDEIASIVATRWLEKAERDASTILRLRGTVDNGNSKSSTSGCTCG